MASAVLLQEAHVVLHQAAEVSSFIPGLFHDLPNGSFLGRHQRIEHAAHLAQASSQCSWQSERAGIVLPLRLGGWRNLLVTLHVDAIVVFFIQAAVAGGAVGSGGGGFHGQREAVSEVERVWGRGGDADVTQPLSSSGAVLVRRAAALHGIGAGHWRLGETPRHCLLDGPIVQGHVAAETVCIEQGGRILTAEWGHQDGFAEPFGWRGW